VYSAASPPELAQPTASGASEHSQYLISQHYRPSVWSQTRKLTVFCALDKRSDEYETVIRRPPPSLLVFAIKFTKNMVYDLDVSYST
jgi:hypothetical protein